jgi:hypothetical protein
MPNTKQWYYVPTAEYEEDYLDYLDFKVYYEDQGCTCFSCAPCSWCVHPGNPHNGVEFERAYNIGEVAGTIKSEFHLLYLVAATRTFGKRVLHVTFAAWSVGHVLGGSYVS